MSKVIDFSSAKQRDPDQNTPDWTGLRKVDEWSRFHLHGLTYQEEEGYCCPNETLCTNNPFANVTTNVTIMVEKAPFSSPAPLSPPEEIEPPDKAEDLANIARPWDEEHACDSIFDQEEAENEPVDATIDGRFYIDGHFNLRSNGLPWVEWEFKGDSAYTNDGGHYHEILPDLEESTFQDPFPQNFSYYRDGISMRTHFQYLEDALVYVRKEIEAQFLFERKLWMAFWCSGPSKTERDYVLSHAHYRNRNVLIREALERRREPRAMSL
jgi:hypothetical protein